MLLVRFLRAMLGAGIGGVVWYFYIYFFERNSPYQVEYRVSISRMVQIIIFCMMGSILVSGIIALSRKYLGLEMRMLARIAIGVIILEVPTLVLSYGLAYDFFSERVLLRLLKASILILIVGGLPGLFYGSASSSERD